MAKNQAPVGRQAIFMAVSSNSFPASPSLNTQRFKRIATRRRPNTFKKLRFTIKGDF